MTFAGENRNIRNIFDAKLELSNLWAAVRRMLGIVPAGMIAPGVFADGKDPDGWLLCDGRKNLSTKQYNALYNVIGTFYGSDGEGKFAIPDLRGKFLFGSSSDPSAAGRVGNTEAFGDTGTTYSAMRVNWFIKT